MPDLLRIQLLGGFRLVQGDTVLHGLEAPSLRSLVTYLLVHRALPLPRQQIASALWPDTLETQAQANLRTQFVRLRRAWPDVQDYLDVGVRQVQWRAEAPVALDVAEFEAAVASAAQAAPASAPDARAALEKAVALYRGELFPGSYEDWLLPERERLHQLYLQALWKLVVLLEQHEENVAAVGYAQRLLHHEPLDESLYQHLMRLHAHRGDRAGVVRVFETCRTVLQQELGVAPSPPTQALYQGLIEAPADAAPTPPAAPERRHNLPHLLTSFVGRELELVQLRQRLGEVRLLTLTGPGGCGKTRLALQLAGQLLANFADGGWWIDLASVADSETVPRVVATALGVPPPSGPEPNTALAEHLRARQLLLVLDNCEHLLAACAALAQALLSACPEITLLATSLAPLGVASESLWPVPNLALPASDDAAAVEQAEAVLLFVERARLALPTFSLGPRNRGAVAQICRRLDGIPLAIELAAARVRVLAPAEIADRLNDRFDFLKGTPSGRVARHQTLRSLVDWSYGLLAPEDQVLLRRLAVFARGFTLEAAEAVCEDEGQAVLDGLAHLVDWSLVFAESATTADTRYRLLETIHHYAWTKLQETSEAERWRNRHLDYFLRLAANAEPQLYGPQQVSLMDQLDGELDDIRAALDWALGSGQVEAAMRLAGDLWLYWKVRGYWNEGFELLQKALAANGPVSPEVRARTLYRAGYVASWQANAEAVALLEQSVGLCRDLGDSLDLGLALTLLAWRVAHNDLEKRIAQMPLLDEARALLREQGHPWGLSVNLSVSAYAAIFQGNLPGARRFAEESLAIARSMGNDWYVVIVLYTLAEFARFAGEYAQAEALYEEVGTLGRRLRFGKHSQAAHRTGLGYTALRQARVDRAQTLFGEGLLAAQEARSWGMVSLAMAGLAGVAAARNEPVRAARLLAAAQACLDAHNEVREPQDQVEFERDLATIRQALDETAFAAAWAAGQAMSTERAIAYGLAHGDETQPPVPQSSH